MNALVVYDSQYGNTERLAMAIADTLRTSGDVKAVRLDPRQAPDLAGIDLLILGSPTQGWQSTKTMQAMLAGLTADQVRGMVVACFDTRFNRPRWMTGSAAKQMAKSLRQVGVTPVVPPESFFVDHTEGPLSAGELGRAAMWARTVIAKVGTPQPVTRQ